jgi:hypothetical protein
MLAALKSLGEWGEEVKAVKIVGNAWLAHRLLFFFQHATETVNGVQRVVRLLVCPENVMAKWRRASCWTKRSCQHPRSSCKVHNFSYFFVQKSLLMQHLYIFTKRLHH